jgi:V/A-type H+/Na+-transporting ATPase subunit D
MSDLTPTRSVVAELRDEQRAMREGYVFLDEKCLLLAGEIVNELGRYTVLANALRDAAGEATRALAAAVARHGLEGLQVHPAGDLREMRIAQRQRTLMGVRLVEASLVGPLPARVGAIDASPEAERCRAAFVGILHHATALAAVAGNLERLSLEYRRSLRRARALDDVLLPEIARVVGDLETRLEELEQEDAIWMSRAAFASGGRNGP